MSPHVYITERQITWAMRHGIPLMEDRHTKEVNDNLFLPLTPDVTEALGQDEPDEQIRAVYSSMALVVNVFFYWKLYGQHAAILEAMGIPGHDGKEVDLQFEVGCPIGWRDGQGHNRPPAQLDVVLRLGDRSNPALSRAIAVESKFREPYGNVSNEFAEAYLSEANAPMWSGLGPLRQLAQDIVGGEAVFERLKASQLIKHTLGLSNQFGGIDRFELVYLWYAAPGPEAVRHQEEIDRFRQACSACNPRVAFRPLRYDDLILQLAKSQGDRHGAYIDYLMERYF